MQCSVIQCCAIQCSAIQCGALQFSKIRWSTVECSKMQFIAPRALFWRRVSPPSASGEKALLRGPPWLSSLLLHHVSRLPSPSPASPGTVPDCPPWQGILQELLQEVLQELLQELLQGDSRRSSREPPGCWRESGGGERVLGKLPCPPARGHSPPEGVQPAGCTPPQTHWPPISSLATDV